MSDPLFLRACRGEPTERTPIWLMRQAGRYMPEYRAIRKQNDFWTVCKTPELACEVTMQPINAFKMDAAILFCDLLVSLPPLGYDVRFGSGVGPVVDTPIHTGKDLDRLQKVDAASAFDYVSGAVKLIVDELPKEIPLIGFAGAPFTLSSYLIEGGSSRVFAKTKAFLHQEPEAAEALFDALTQVTIDLLNLQIDAGCRAVQIFDSWAGVLDPDDYAKWGLRYTKRIVEAVRRPGVPVIVFAKGTGCYFDTVAQCGADVLGVDWTQRYDRVRAEVGPDIALQGNLDPYRLLGPWENTRGAVDRLLDSAGDGRGHIFNLGHGINKDTDPRIVGKLVDHVKSASERSRP